MLVVNWSINFFPSLCLPRICPEMGEKKWPEQQAFGVCGILALSNLIACQKC
jgi:hypothetical protein